MDNNVLEPIECVPLGSWVKDLGKDNRANLFWARTLAGVRPEAIESIGARASSACLDYLPTPNDVTATEFSTIVHDLAADGPVMQFVHKTYGDALAACATRLDSVLGTTPSQTSMERLLLLSLHPECKSQWNAVVPSSAWVDARTLFVATAELDVMREIVHGAAANTEAYTHMLRTLLVH
jgi:hypothetical protein